MPYSAVRLVTPLENPVTGEQRDVIVERLKRRLDYMDQETLEKEYVRFIPDLNDTEVAWPEKDEPAHIDTASDTLRISLEKRTFAGPNVTLLGAPMPPSVIDELRNKYSKLRKRHDPEYLEEVRQREEEQRMNNIQMMQGMRTPLQELHALRAEQRKKAAEENGESTIRRPIEKQVKIQSGKPWKWTREDRKPHVVDDKFLAQLGAMLVDKRAATKASVA